MKHTPQATDADGRMLWKLVSLGTQKSGSLRYMVLTACCLALPLALRALAPKSPAHTSTHSKLDAAISPKGSGHTFPHTKLDAAISAHNATVHLSRRSCDELAATGAGVSNSPGKAERWSYIEGTGYCSEWRFGDSSTVREGVAQLTVWVAARRFCEKLGSRMCTSSELRAGAARHLSCGEPSCSVWSGSFCGEGASGFHLIENPQGGSAQVANLSKVPRGAPPNCDASILKHALACCADKLH